MQNFTPEKLTRAELKRLISDLDDEYEAVWYDIEEYYDWMSEDDEDGLYEHARNIEAKLALARMQLNQLDYNERHEV